ncbi:MAG: hypothetical protein IT384_00515 [Deltaproteobacteria bacterium]|nr:hypothetical protein [Deltaproteobacteria bacterium]
MSASRSFCPPSTAPKQTETTQRWKLNLRSKGRTVPLHTKIEFSRRGAEGDSKLEPVDGLLTRHYQLPPILAAHYLLGSAIRQKVGALVGRAEVQARDVFDLSLLVAKAGGDLRAYGDLLEQVSEAIARTEGITYGEFMGQVVAFLVPEHADAYASEEAWIAMQLQVIDALRTIEAVG